MNTTDTAIAKLTHVYEGHMRPADALEAATTVVSGWTADRIAAYAQEAPMYEIEMFDGYDQPRHKYGVVHAARCRDLRDPEPVGDNWREGVANLGTDWEMDVEDDAIHLAPCAKRLERATDPKITTTLTAPGERAVKRDGRYIGMVVRDREGWGYGHTSRTPHFTTFTEAAQGLATIR